MTEDYFTHTEADAGEWARAHAEPDDDRPTRAECDADEAWLRAHEEDER